MTAELLRLNPRFLGNARSCLRQQHRLLGQGAFRDRVTWRRPLMLLSARLVMIVGTDVPPRCNASHHKPGLVCARCVPRRIVILEQSFNCLI